MSLQIIINIADAVDFQHIVIAVVGHIFNIFIIKVNTQFWLTKLNTPYPKTNRRKDGLR